MTTFRATNLDTSQITAYDAVAPDPIHLGSGWRLEEVSAATVAPNPTVYGGRRRITKQEFFDLLGNNAVGFLLTAAKSSVEIEAWIKRLDLVTPDPDGASVDLDDPRTVAGTNQLGALMVANGVVSADWAQGVLNG